MTDELTTPVPPEPPKYFGPSFVAMDRHESGTNYKAGVWIGGEGRGKDGRWGEVIELSYFRQFNAASDLEWSILQLIGKHQQFLREKYTVEGAAIVSLLLVSAVKGQTTNRHFTVEDFKGAVEK